MKKQKSPKSAEKKPMGRPSIITDKLTDEIANYIRAGNYIETASAMCGISRDSVYTWLKAGEKGKSPETVYFADTVKKAMAESEARDVIIISKAAEKYWQASAWRLERKHPERWGRKDRLSIMSDNIVRGSMTEEEEKTFISNYKMFFGSNVLPRIGRPLKERDDDGIDDD